MNIPNGARPERLHRGTLVPWSQAETIWRSLECLIGGIAAIFIVLLNFPALVELTRPLHLLSTTGLAAILIFVWIFLWAVIATAGEQLRAAIG